MYEYMIDLMTSTEEAERDAQIIVVDNDIPLFIREKFAGYIVAQFSSTGEGGLPIGLIDDARTVS
ncbi:exonuclease SbcC domain protein [Janthinobacterium sp. BJB1]|nr:exonuclease SbcC domain protein [Janthinobacterium sp. BJB1]